MDSRTAIDLATPRTRRTPLGDTVTVRAFVNEDGIDVEDITVEVPLSVVAEGRVYPERKRPVSTERVWP